MQILCALGNFAGGLADFSEAFLRAGYGASTRGIYYQLGKIRRKRRRDDHVAPVAEKIKLLNLLYKMRDDGLIYERHLERGSRICITDRGEKKRDLLQKNKQASPFSLGTRYSKEKSDYVIIVAFDVPEREKIKRVWLRAVLKNLGFSMIQKSMWVGMTKIPEDLLRDIDKLHMGDFIEIFSVTKTGSLRRVV